MYDFIFKNAIQYYTRITTIILSLTLDKSFVVDFDVCFCAFYQRFVFSTQINVMPNNNVA